MNPIHIKFDCLPFRELRPNEARRQGHWAVRSQVSHIARTQAYILGTDLHFKGPPLELFQLDVIFTLPTKRRIDLDGLFSAAKSWIDGIVDAKLLLNDDWWHMKKITISAKYEKGVEQTEFIITEIKENKDGTRR